MAAASAMTWMNWLSIAALGIGIVALAASLAIPGPVGSVGSPGSTGQTGETGPEGLQGPPGISGISGYEIVSRIHTVPIPGFHDLNVFCSTGKRALGGGAGDPVGTSGLITRQSFPIVGGSGWAVRVEINSAPSEVQVWATCAVVT